MSKPVVLLVLLVAALLEAGGDALVRTGLRAPGGAGRLLWMACGGIVLLTYGIVVNTPAWDFGRLLGLYVVFFFIVAQVIAWLAFDQLPSRSLLAGGALIVAGGAIISIWSQ